MKRYEEIVIVNSQSINNPQLQFEAIRDANNKISEGLTDALNNLIEVKIWYSKMSKIFDKIKARNIKEINDENHFN